MAVLEAGLDVAGDRFRTYRESARKILPILSEFRQFMKIL